MWLLSRSAQPAIYLGQSGRCRKAHRPTCRQGSHAGVRHACGKPCRCSITHKCAACCSEAQWWERRRPGSKPCGQGQGLGQAHCGPPFSREPKAQQTHGTKAFHRRVAHVLPNEKSPVGPGMLWHCSWAQGGRKEGGCRCQFAVLHRGRQAVQSAVNWRHARSRGGRRPAATAGLGRSQTVGVVHMQWPLSTQTDIRHDRPENRWRKKKGWVCGERGKRAVRAHQDVPLLHCQPAMASPCVPLTLRQLPSL